MVIESMTKLTLRYCKFYLLLIHEADPLSRSVVITIFESVVCIRLTFRTSVPIFQNLAKQNNFQARIVVATGEAVGLAEWIIDDDTHVLYPLMFSLHTSKGFLHLSSISFLACSFQFSCWKPLNM